MGLAEKRAAAEFEKTVYPPLVQQIHDAAGFAVPIEVRWDTLTKEEKQVARWREGWPKIYFQPIIDAFHAICVDDIGREAVKAAVKKIVVQNTQASYTSYWATLADGTLTLDYMFTNENAVKDRTDVLVSTLEKAL